MQVSPSKGFKERGETAWEACASNNKEEAAVGDANRTMILFNAVEGLATGAGRWQEEKGEGMDSLTSAAYHIPESKRGTWCTPSISQRRPLVQQWN